MLFLPYFFCFWAVRQIKLAISSAFERITLIYRTVSYRNAGKIILPRFRGENKPITPIKGRLTSPN